MEIGLQELVLLLYMSGTLLSGLVLRPDRIIPRAYVLAIFFLPSQAVLDIPGPIPPLDKLGAVSFPALLLLIAAKRDLRGLRWKASDRLAVAFLGMIVAANLAAGNKPYAVAARSLDLLVTFTMPYLAGRLWARKPDQLVKLTRFIITVGFLYVPFMVIEFRLAPQFARLIYDSQVSFAQSARYGFFRPFMFFRHALDLGHTMTLVLGFAIAYRIWLSGRRNRGEKPPSITIAALLLAVLLSMSRGPVMGAILIICGYHFFRRHAWRLGWFLGISGMLLFTWMVWTASAHQVVDLLGLGGDARAQSLAYRFAQIDAYSPLFHHRPYLGHGHPIPRNYWYPIIDGTMLLLAMEAGLLCLGLFTAWVLAICRQGMGAWERRPGLGAITGAFFAIQVGWLLFSAWGDSFLSSFHFFLGGALVSQAKYRVKDYLPGP
mgnify:CR=1 FL=1